MNFKDFKKDVESAFNNMIAENLFVANVDKDLLWMGYLLSFEEMGLFGTEAVLKHFEAETPNYVDCGTDVDKFINTCLQFK